LKRLIFALGFFLGLASAVAANVYAYHVAEPACCHFSISFGFPFHLGTTGGFINDTSLILSGLYLDIAVGVVTSLIFASSFAIVIPTLIGLLREVGEWHLKTRS